MSQSSVKGQIMTAIANTDESHLKTVLILMVGILDEIGGKIDSVLADEKTLREAVLNGHAGVHDEDHEWIKVQRQKEQAASSSKRKIAEGVVEKAAWALLAAIAVYVFK